jgi:hypothetical protein
MDDFLGKPYTVHDVTATLARWLPKRQLSTAGVALR